MGHGPARCGYSSLWVLLVVMVAHMRLRTRADFSGEYPYPARHGAG
ncbi:unannotated protein [freshwater metagenome]|uniref:Unannotated protein n=1 Tax=freshwater metagenome TaxID=449393 RepID=A0A6J6T5B6_9ZZZZ|nr:hypothetical protein [Actinomycetota bacterium]MSY79111.1 hypothetical protein [Actinomycetota bacterium]